MANLVQLDASVIFDFFAAGETCTKTKNFLEDRRAALAAITIYELFAGVKTQRHIEQREAFGELCEIIELTGAIARRAAKVYSQLKDSGSLIANEDILLAACSLHCGYPLFALNRSHFERIEGLVLV